MQDERLLPSNQLAQSSGFQSPASEMTSDEEDRESVSYVYLVVSIHYYSAIRHLLINPLFHQAAAIPVMKDQSIQASVSMHVFVK